MKNKNSLYKGNSEDTELEEIHQTMAEEKTEKDNVRSDEGKLEVNRNKKYKLYIIFCTYTSTTRRAQDLNQTNTENEEETMEESRYVD